MNKKICVIIGIIAIIVTMIAYPKIKDTGNEETIVKKAEKETEVSKEEKPYIEIIGDMTNYTEDKTINVDIELKNMTENISYIDGYIEYNKDIFEEIQPSDFSVDYSEDETLSYFTYTSKKGKILMEFEKDTEVKTVCHLKLKVKDTITKPGKAYISVKHGYTYSYEPDLEIDLEDVTKTFTIPGVSDGEKLYLSTEKYKIGNNDIKNYEEGDKYISRVEKETTKEEYINNLETNGTIRILKPDGTELGENELVGTGMTLEVTKDDEKIELQIAVTGDLSGDGKVTATDLSTLNQTIQKLVTLENEYKIAGDTDENESITATDLSTINKMLLKIL